jgi:hypothetical protein
MRMSNGFPIRVAVYGTVLLLVLADMIFGGPLRQRMDRQRPDSPESLARARAQGIVARVFKHPITRQQLNRAVAERLLLDGRQDQPLGGNERKLLTYAVLNDLIDHQLLRVKTQANSSEVPLSEAEIDAAVAGFRSRFPSGTDFPALLATQGIGSEKELRFRLAATLQQEKYIETRIHAAIQVSAEEARAWYDANPQAAEVPPAARARHIFFSTMSRTPDEAHALLDGVRTELAGSGGSFAALAAMHSEDEATKGSCGDLGWIEQRSMPADLLPAVLTLKLNEPAVVRSRLGWHLVEVTEHRDATRRPFEDMQAEISTALEAQKRSYAVAEYRRGLRHPERNRVHVDKEGLFPSAPAGASGK